MTLGRGVAWEDFTTGDPPLGYYVHEATFPYGETMIRVSHLARPTVSAGGRRNETRGKACGRAGGCD